MKKFQKRIYFLLLLCFPHYFLAGNLFSVAEMVDSVYGITYYEKYNHEVGGEEIRLDDYGEPCENTVIDYYDDGNVLHRGTYVKGILVTYKNFFPDGKIERKFKGLAGGRYSHESFYPSGVPKSKMVYYRKDVIFWNEFYENGQIEYTEKYNSRFLLLYRKTYTIEGKPLTLFELVNKKKSIYSHKEYFENGLLSEEGGMVFSDEIVDFKREGKWKIYDETGKLVRVEEYIHGEFNTETQANATTSTTTIPPTTSPPAKNNVTKLTAEEIDAFFEEEEETPPATTTPKTKKKKKQITPHLSTNPY